MYDSISRNLAPLLFSIGAIALAAMLTLALPGGEPPEDAAPPVADAGPDVEAWTGETVPFDGTGSTDDRDIQTWQWSLEYRQPRRLRGREGAGHLRHSWGVRGDPGRHR